MQVVTREEWGAAPSRGALVPLRGAKGVVVHWFGGTVPNTDHSQCAELVKGIQAGAFRRTDATYVDIEYNLLACQHGFVFVGRGVGVKPAAQGAANAEYFAVCALSGPEGVSVPSSAMLQALDDAITDLRTNGPAGGEVLGHHDVPGNSTDCPGPDLLTLVHEGFPFLHATPNPPAPAPSSGEVTVTAWPSEDSTLWGIAQHYLGDGRKWTELAELNGISDGNEVKPGQVIKLPAASPAA